MAEQSISNPHAEWSLGGWDAFTASVDELIRRRPRLPSTDEGGRAAHTLRERVERGITTVPIYRIVPCPTRGAVFDRWAPQPSQDVAVEAHSKAPPIVLCKVGESYFVRDGSQRIATARARGQLFLRAHVVEYLIDSAVRSNEALQFLLTHERAEFFARFPFPEEHPAHAFIALTLGNYDQLGKHIEHTAGLYRRADENEQAWLVRWYDELYLPVARMIRRRGVLQSFSGGSEIDLYLWAIERRGLWADGQPLRQQLRKARRSIAALWVGLRSQQVHEYL